ncbi:MAG: hypothetical protein AAF957_11845 [Planctomycetota bacterium]
MRHRILAAAAVTALLTGLSAAQERVDVVYTKTVFSGSPQLGVIELDAGGCGSDRTDRPAGPHAVSDRVGAVRRARRIGGLARNQ